MRPTIHPDRWSLVFYSAILQQPHVFLSSEKTRTKRGLWPRANHAKSAVLKKKRLMSSGEYWGLFIHQRTASAKSQTM